jgi:phage shock protein PspC (stress-responsive transcriptional regulator)
MSATMSYRTEPVMRDAWISGVCADIAARAAVPVWLPRAAFVLFGMLHWLLAAILYVALARIMRPRMMACRARYAPPPPSYGFGSAQERFRNLDERLSNLEAATVRNESELRRAFRDLERG